MPKPVEHKFATVRKGQTPAHRGDAVWHARSAYRGGAALPSPEPVPVRNAVRSERRSPSGAARVEQREQDQSGKEAADMGLPCDPLLDAGETLNRDAELSPTPPFDLIVSAWASV